MIKETIFLSEYAVELRYDIEFSPEIDVAETALEAVIKIKQLVLSLLPKALHP